MIFYYQYEISDRWNTIILEFWDFDRRPTEYRGSKLRFLKFSTSIIKFLNDQHALYWKFGSLAGLESRPQVQVATDSFKACNTCLRLGVIG
jgi:hypothetical protein